MRFLLLFVILSLTSCSTLQKADRSSKSIDWDPDSPTTVIVRKYLDEENYHQAMRCLPRAVKEWDDIYQKTGNSHEGAAGFIVSHTLSRVANHGDTHWGKILDDPDIPYSYKTNLLLDILESRLGKGSIYSGDENHFIVPRFGRTKDFKEELELKPKKP